MTNASLPFPFRFSPDPKNDRVRYTIGPAARKVVLKRLLELNHQRSNEEKVKAPATKPKGSGRKKAAMPPTGPGLFGDL